MMRSRFAIAMLCLSVLAAFPARGVKRIPKATPGKRAVSNSAKGRSAADAAPVVEQAPTAPAPAPAAVVAQEVPAITKDEQDLIDIMTLRVEKLKKDNAKLSGEIEEEKAARSDDARSASEVRYDKAVAEWEKTSGYINSLKRECKSVDADDVNKAEELLNWALGLSIGGTVTGTISTITSFMQSDTAGKGATTYEQKTAAANQAAGGGITDAEYLAQEKQATTNKRLAIASAISSVITTGTSAASGVTSGIAASKLSNLVKQVDKCKKEVDKQQAGGY